MEMMAFSTEEVTALVNSISAEGEPVNFTPEQTERSGRRYMDACSKNDQEERAHRAEVMRDASQIVFF